MADASKSKTRQVLGILLEVVIAPFQIALLLVGWPLLQLQSLLSQEEFKRLDALAMGHRPRLREDAGRLLIELVPVRSTGPVKTVALDEVSKARWTLFEEVSAFSNSEEYWILEIRCRDGNSIAIHRDSHGVSEALSAALNAKGRLRRPRHRSFGHKLAPFLLLMAWFLILALYLLWLLIRRVWLLGLGSLG